MPTRKNTLIQKPIAQFLKLFDFSQSPQKVLSSILFDIIIKLSYLIQPERFINKILGFILGVSSFLFHFISYIAQIIKWIE